jgi:trk system potassium uptake protein TrkA
MKKRVLLIGGFQKARSLADSLVKKGYPVTAINNNYKNCLILNAIEGLTVINGDGTNFYVLDEANAKDADIAIALTPRDDDNLVICELCKKRFNVRKTVAVINDPKKSEFFYRMGIDSVVCATNTISGIIEQQAFTEEISTLIPIGEGRNTIAEVPILPGAPAAGKKLWEIALPNEVIVGCILRGEKSLIPRGDTRILAGDTLVLISSDLSEIAAIRELTGR